MAVPLSPETRAAALAALPAADLDLLVVGGGITGAGVARDAALRGLRTALLERVDFAAGTSSRSSKLIHGGVRYLEQGDVALVREAAAERQVLRRIAPHLAEPRLMVLPTYRRATHAKLGIGLWTFEKIATVAPDERHRMWDRAATLREEPLLAPAGLHGAAAFVEYLTDDARLVLATVRAAHEAGALVANYAEVVAIEAGRPSAVTARDALSGATLRARARAVVNAAGPWVDTVRGLAGAGGGRRLRLTKGIHVVVSHARLPIRHVVVMQARDRRSVFAVPRDGVTYLGTTDTDYGAPTLYPAVTADDADYLLEAANRTFSGPPLGRADVLGAWAGLRPLLHEEGKRPSEISRKDEIMVDAASGLVSIAGGKLTTYRTMAERVVDLVCRRLGASGKPGRTAALPLPGGERAPGELPALVRRVAEALPRLGPGAAERLVRLHGTGAEAICARAAADRDAGAPLPGLPDVPRAEVEHVLETEMALTLTDVLERRTRALLFAPGQGLEAAETVAALMARRLGWDAARAAAEVDRYRRLATSLRSFPRSET
ncbi:MAG TPA: glycerol-3-phosphate dehydrogenase/oxidase [Candidatus Binatia bacterium]|nr:glycerol-3-phosphate dehydrogenase/oxidase [Candidatus Binatia bacterium]